MDNKTLSWLREKLRNRSNRYMFKNRDELTREAEAVLEGRIEELEDIIRLIDLQLLGNPNLETFLRKKPLN